MAGIVGQQDFWVVGSRLYFQDENDTDEALLDLGVVQTVNPTIEQQQIQLVDGDGGRRKIVDTTTIQIDETWEIVVHNFAIDNLAILFRALSVTDPNQGTGEQLAVEHKAIVGPGKYLKLKDSSGNWIYNVDSIVVKSDGGGTTYVEDDDWKWVSKPRGIIQILDGGAIAALGDPAVTLDIDITPFAITGLRRIYPHTAEAEVKGKALLVWGRNNNAEQTMREADVSLTTTATQFQLDDYSSFTLTAQVESDITETTAPAGMLLNAVGALPAAPAGVP